MYRRPTQLRYRTKYAHAYPEVFTFRKHERATATAVLFFFKF